eukprot:75475-Chlamydomonas_euryale.AAC.5
MFGRPRRRTCIEGDLCYPPTTLVTPSETTQTHTTCYHVYVWVCAISAVVQRNEEHEACNFGHHMHLRNDVRQGRHPQNDPKCHAPVGPTRSPRPHMQIFRPCMHERLLKLKPFYARACPSLDT